MKYAIFLILMIICLSCGCIIDDENNDVLYKDIESAEIPSSCVEHKDNVCALFDCMVENCWCDTANYPSPILYEPMGIIISNEQDAIDNVNTFINQNVTKYEGYSITKAVKLNNVFYNVFAENSTNDEISFTVAVDGIILKTLCGV